MDTENNQEGNRLKLRIAVATILALGGFSLVGIALTSIPQSGLWPEWVVPILIIGVIAIVVAFLILIISPRRWRNIWQSIIGFPRWLKETCVWIFCGPKCTIGDPTFNQSEVSKVGQDYYETKITATFGVTVKNKSKPIRVNFSPAEVCLEQIVGWDQKKVPFILETHKGIPKKRLEPRKSDDYEVEVYLVCGGGDREHFPDIHKDYRWGIQGIYVVLPRGLSKELRKGIYYRAPRKLLYYLKLVGHKCRIKK